MQNRRQFIKSGFSYGAGLLLLKKNNLLRPHRTAQRITNPAKGFHWFGYYDKFQTDPTDRYVLGMRVAFEGRSPTAQDEVVVGMIDTFDHNRWTDLGTSRAWGWQQGCMLQFIPQSLHEVIWNDTENGRYVSRIVNIKTGKKRTLPKPIYALSPDGKWGIGTEFNRIQNLRPGYGYAGIEDPYLDIKAPKEIGLYKIDLKTGQNHLLFSIHDIASIPLESSTIVQPSSVLDNFHWFNHLLVNNDGTRFTFLHRWRAKLEERQTMARTNFVTRMFTADADGQNLYCIDPSGFTSHFIWKDPHTICAFTQPHNQPYGFYLLEDFTGKTTPIGHTKIPANGHQTYLPVGNGTDWILNDNYASPQNRNQTPYLYRVPTNRRIELGDFPAPAEYFGEWRSDLHPKSNRNGTKVIFDSTHEQKGRQMYMIDIAEAMK
ncbi:MAG: hypothetical protein ACK4GN_14090 [Runella sp.]